MDGTTDMDMQQDTTFYTATMARVLAGQGRYSEAARIYRHLLDASPQDPDLRAALAQVTAQAEATGSRWTAVSDRVARWVRLLLEYRRLRQLERIRVPARTNGDPGDG